MTSSSKPSPSIPETNAIYKGCGSRDGDGWAGSGANPWHLDDETESVLFLTNMGERESRIGFKVTALGVEYHLIDMVLKPHETRAIDVRKLRDAQEPDLFGNTIPAGATDGSVTWLRADHVPVMGRMVTLRRKQGTASSYQCTTCCCPATLTPIMNLCHSAIIGVPNDIHQYAACAQYTSCSQSYWWQNVYPSWSSNNPSVATISPGGLATMVSGGSATFTAILSDSNYVCEYWYGTCTYYGPIYASRTSSCDVCSLSVQSPTSNEVFHLGGSNYNTTTLPLVAASACSGTANWTLGYSYTSKTPTIFTATSSTSSTIGQTSNYQSPVGRGGEVTLSASATLAGQPFSANQTAYIDGVAIPDALITSRLVSFYTSGTAPHLLTGICWRESLYRQFEQRTLYGIFGRWPIESPAPRLGEFVGLMQVPNGMLNGNAFDWLANTEHGASVFQEKLAIADYYVSTLQSQYPQLPGLNGVERENEALSRYGGFSDHYYTVNGSGDGWVTTTRQDLLDYVSFIRNNMR